MEIPQHNMELAFPEQDWQHIIRDDNADAFLPENLYEFFDEEFRNDWVPLPPPPLIEEEDDHISLRDADVLSGRGGGSNNNPGNKKFWKMALVLRPTYQAPDTDNATKCRIANQLLMQVRQSGGRFLERDKETRALSFLSEARALEKCKQILRDQYVPQALP
eukprot:Nitzschia sp. Nitz4//scaffold244_size29068//7487//7972//NITZ4_008064-RA/size29068-processed-gene-0.4-mRNA-1//1//CDS//3329543856//7168//frame0